MRARGFVAIAAVLAGCVARPAWDPRALGDIVPPMLEKVGADPSGNVQMTFDEPVLLVEGSLLIAPPCGSTEARPSGTSIIVVAPAQRPGAEYTLEATVEDAAGNSSAVVTRFTGFNPAVPRLILNELITRGSDDHPDLVEIRVLSDGDLAGVTAYQGTAGDWTDRVIFPACRVLSGEYVLVHFKPEGTPEERNETGPRDESGGTDSSPAALDFWVSGGRGLAGNNGVVALYDRPNGQILDGILYSNRSSASDSAYGGFGSASTLARAQELVAGLGWIAATGTVRPEDAVSPELSTATRSIARGRAGIDTNTREDWHISPTRGATWGAENGDESYEPAPR
jgi:hypothetical protein